MACDSAFRVLLIEDDPDDAAVFKSLLEDRPGQFDIAHVERIGQARMSGRAAFDLVVTDLSLPDSTGLATVRQVIELFPDAPVVVLTALSDKDTGVRAVQLGCEDYLLKSLHDPDALSRTLRYAIERWRSQRALRESEERFRRLIDMSPDAVLLVRDKRVEFANAAAARLLASGDHSRLLNQACSFLGAQDARVTQLIDAISADGQEAGRLADCDVATLDQEHLLADLNAVHIPYHGAHAVQLIIRDISDRRQAERQQRLASALFQTTAEAMMVTDANHRIIAINPAFSSITGYNAEDVIGHFSDLLASGRHDADFYARIQAAVDSEGHWRGEVWNRRKDGSIYIQRQTISRVDDDSSAAASYVSVFSDITAEKRAEEALIHVANHDALTGLPNRALLMDRLEQALSKSERTNARLAVLFVDLDAFKPVNDAHGHIIGDSLLQGVASRLLSCIRGSDTVARVGGDEFVVLALDIDDHASAADVAGKLLRSLKAPLRLQDQLTARIGASIGISLYPDDGENALTLLDRADRAMYQAKRGGKDQFAFCRPTSDTSLT